MISSYVGLILNTLYLLWYTEYYPLENCPPMISPYPNPNLNPHPNPGGISSGGNLPGWGNFTGGNFQVTISFYINKPI